MFDVWWSLAVVVVLVGGPRWSRKSMDLRGDSLFVLVLISSGLGPGKSQIPGAISRKGRRHGVDPWSFALDQFKEHRSFEVDQSILHA